MSQTERLIPNEQSAPWDLCVPTTLRSPQVLSEILESEQRKQSLFKQISLLRQEIPNASAAQIRAVTISLEKTIAPLIEWARKPRVRSELFMYRRSITGDKFFKLVSYSLEEILDALLQALTLVSPKWTFETLKRRAQIMSIRGLALSCAPNYTRISDFNSFSRLHRGHA